MGLRSQVGIATACLALCGAVAYPQTSDAPNPHADRLGGDWGGARTKLAARGVTMDFESTHYYQGLLSGTGSDDFEYGGRLDALLNLDTGKLGLWQGGLIRSHAEFRYGELGASRGGNLIATNTGMILPSGAHEKVRVTSLHLAQRINERMNLLVGRINPLDLLAEHPFFGGAGRSRMLNLAFAAPPSGITPPVMVGAIATLRAADLNWTAMLYDPDDRTNDFWPSHLFDSGVTLSLSANHAGAWRSHTTSITLQGSFSTKNGANLGELLLPPDLQTGQRNHSWYFGGQFIHFLYEGGQPGDGWGVFLNAAASDGNPNPFQGSLMAGLGGSGLFPARPQDTFGIGYFYVDFSDALQSSVSPLLVFDDEQGVEAYYGFAVRSWLLLSADLQYADPALGSLHNAFTGGLRFTVRF